MSTTFDRRMLTNKAYYVIFYSVTSQTNMTEKATNLGKESRLVGRAVDKRRSLLAQAALVERLKPGRRVSFSPALWSKQRQFSMALPHLYPG
jgi:hypothetical protein